MTIYRNLEFEKAGGAWAQAQRVLRLDASAAEAAPASDRPLVARRLDFVAPGGTELLVDDVLVYEPAEE